MGPIGVLVRIRLGSISSLETGWQWVFQTGWVLPPDYTTWSMEGVSRSRLQTMGSGEFTIIIQTHTATTGLSALSGRARVLQCIWRETD